MKAAYRGIRKTQKASRRAPLPKGTHVVIVGHGMVADRFLEYLVKTKVFAQLSVTVIGDEPHRAYDRIRLSSYVDRQEADDLILQHSTFYEEHQINLLTGIRVSTINTDNKSLTTSDRQNIPYDTLVLATGSRPFVPPFPGHNLPGVYLYRNLADLDQIISASQGKERAVIIGGGLLGLEAAQAVQKLGLEATIIERAEFLMPRQLNETAAQTLQREVEAQGIQFHLSQQNINLLPDGKKLVLKLDDESTHTFDLCVVSAGITPNSELAAEASIEVGLRGGVVVNEYLETNHPDVYAIGECALFHGRIWGLAAPGFTMAKHLAEYLDGNKLPPLAPPNLSTRLKMMGVEMVTVGDPLEPGRTLEFTDEEKGIYRLFSLDGKSGINGALAIGPWEEANLVQTLFQDEEIIKPAEEERFLASGSLKKEGEPSQAVTQWPDERIVCNCLQVTKGNLVDCLDTCKRDPELLARKTGASSVCGSCSPLLAKLCGSSNSVAAKPIATRSLLIVSALALIGGLLAIFSPAPAMADSVESSWYQFDKFWRNNFLKQVTGYSLMGIFLLGLLLSLRKHIRWFRIGHFARWRAFHAIFGLTSLVALFVHTGFRFGHNLNFWLMATFVALNLLGAIAGVASAIESRGTSEAALFARRIRPSLTYAHLVLFWPLPILLTFHILSVYLY